MSGARLVLHDGLGHRVEPALQAGLVPFEWLHMHVPTA
jgi:hypothetical protein